MSLKRLSLFLIVLCVLCIGFSIWLFLAFSQKQQQPDLPQPLYILSEQSGHLAVFSPNQSFSETPVKTYPVYTRLLPEIDQRKLAAGIEIYSETQLQQRLEDYGL